jgi:hypothetical protein
MGMELGMGLFNEFSRRKEAGEAPYGEIDKPTEEYKVPEEPSEKKKLSQRIKDLLRIKEIRKELGEE